MSKRYCQTLELKNDPELIKKYVEAHDREHHWREIREGTDMLYLWASQ